MLEPSARSQGELFAQLALTLHAAPGPDETMDAVIESALHLAGCTQAGIVLAGPHSQATVGAVTDPLVERLYNWQISVGSGPMLDALSGPRTVYVADAAAATDWIRWRNEAVGLGFGSVLHVPMLTASRVEGVLSLYHREPHAFSDADAVPVAHILARHATVAVAGSRREQNLAQAIDARKLVGQAMGILMERYDLDGDRAFEVLKRYSQTSNTKLHAVAQQLIDTRRLPKLGPSQADGPATQPPDELRVPDSTDGGGGGETTDLTAQPVTPIEPV
ncbi:hypothetical protein GCM10009630_21360 [Kribbella jejuensis]|uniref:GAF domain-containing protein n=1 Tax=Kribbella jejuensis TaxID=236068 RepID=A0A542DSX2_9ACTN|nr:GAF domain-containing protein [Kribbella jejuensis]